MTCEEIKNQIIIKIYGKQTPEQKRELEKHIQECPQCAKVYGQLNSFSGMYEKKDDITFPHLGKSWRVISERVFTKKRFSLEFFPRHKMMLAAAATLIVFLLGIFVGRQLFYNNFEATKLVTTQPHIEESLLGAYAESLELVLIDFPNHKNVSAQDDYSILQQKLILEMLAQTEILKFIYTQENNEQLANLFEDIELILLSVSNLKPGDKDFAIQLNQIIQEKAIFDQLHSLSKQHLII